jgi:hypothetical protein
VAVVLASGGADGGLLLVELVVREDVAEVGGEPALVLIAAIRTQKKGKISANGDGLPNTTMKTLRTVAYRVGGTDVGGAGDHDEVLLVGDVDDGEGIFVVSGNNLAAKVARVRTAVDDTLSVVGVTVRRKASLFCAS